MCSIAQCSIALFIKVHPRIQVSTIEFSLIQVSVMHGLEQGNEVLKQIHKELNLENVEKLLEETQEAREYQRVRYMFTCHRFCDLELWLLWVIQEIDEMLANSLSFEEEESVQAELAALQREEVSQLQPCPTITDIPDSAWSPAARPCRQIPNGTKGRPCGCTAAR